MGWSLSIGDLESHHLVVVLFWAVLDCRRDPVTVLPVLPEPVSSNATAVLSKGFLRVLSFSQHEGDCGVSFVGPKANHSSFDDE